MGRWGGSLGDDFPRAMVSAFKGFSRYRLFQFGLEVGPSQLGMCHAFNIPGTGRARARAAKLGLPFLDGTAPADRRVTNQPGLRAHISHGGGALRLPWLGYGAKRRTLYLGIGRRPIPHCTFYLGMSRGPIPSCTLHLGMSLQPIPRYKVCKGRAY